ncbi:TPA: hypothetical protein LR347_001696 [Enterobacter hormaechei]|uniref:hypothetical protein n=1 Tax=Enterobacter roggenkampii TaxID=1812935 RepID=UPI0013F4C60E|nr:hypothetical protein [Enterobacter roggenkampii]HBL5390674.1 hypothetical protein [Enterobacter hormaechei]HDT2125347.1 hypothetical protein [Enterobacter roggenkampii]
MLTKRRGVFIFGHKYLQLTIWIAFLGKQPAQPATPPDTSDGFWVANSLHTTRGAHQVAVLKINVTEGHIGHRFIWYPAGVEPALGRETQPTPEADTLNKKGGQPSEHYHLPPVGMVEDWITAKARNAQVMMNRAKNYVFPYSLR